MRIVSGLVSFIMMMFAGWLTAWADAPGHSFVAPGLGAYFQEPHELAGPASRAQLFTARPMALLRAGIPVRTVERLSIAPLAGVMLPRFDHDKVVSINGLIAADAAYSVFERFHLLMGLGAQLGARFSQSRLIERSGTFVTPSGSSLSWAFTTNFGVAYWLDHKLRLEAETFVTRLFNAQGRRARFALGLSYVL